MRLVNVILSSFLLWICMLFPAQLSADTVTLVSTNDTSLFEHDPDNNLGSSSSVAAGTTAGLGAPPKKSRALFKFDIASKVPSKAVISSVKLTLKVTKAPTPRVNSAFDLRKVLVSWGEGKKGGDTGGKATTGEASWKARSVSTTGASTLWSVPGGAAGADFSGTVSASAQVLGTGTYTFASNAALVADVQAWLANTNSNFGWALISENEGTARTARRFGCRESTASDRPALEIIYTLPPPPPHIDAVSAGNGGFQFTFAAKSGNTYAVQSREILGEGAWTVLTNIDAKLSSFTATVQDPIAGGQRFYQVQASPSR